jgi:hypothetical protein
MQESNKTAIMFQRLGEIEKQLKSEGDKEAREHLDWRADTLYFITEKMQARSNKDVLKPFNDRLDEILCLPYPYSLNESQSEFLVMCASVVHIVTMRKETSAVLDPNSDSGDLFRAIQAYVNLDQVNYIRFHELIDRHWSDEMMNAWSDVAILEGVCAHFPTKETNAIGRLTQRTVAHARGWVDPSVQQDLDDNLLGDAQIYAECFRKDEHELDYRVDQRQTLQTSGRLMIYMNKLHSFGMLRGEIIKECLVGGLPNADPYADIDTSKYSTLVLDAYAASDPGVPSKYKVPVNEIKTLDSNDERFLDQALMKIIQANLTKEIVLEVTRRIQADGSTGMDETYGGKRRVQTLNTTRGGQHHVQAVTSSLLTGVGLIITTVLMGVLPR